MNLLKERLIAIGVPFSVSSDTVKEVQKWLERSGPEWTVNRLKQLKQELISRISDNDYRAPWVARNNSSLPRGPFSWFFRQALSMRDEKISLAINSLMIYSSFVSDIVTEAQKLKFFSSMESNDETGLRSRPKLYPRLEAQSGAAMRHYRPTYFLGAQLSPNKFQPGIDSKSYPETDYVEQFKFALVSDPIRNLIYNYAQELSREVIPMQLFLQSYNFAVNSAGVPSHPVVKQCIGKISFIQEPGYKLRAVANPSRIVQCMMNPLKGFLKELLLETTTDCTFDQEKGIQRIQGWLREGKRCHSIDLSDATNTFPRNYQISLAQLMINQVTDENYQAYLSNALDVFTACCEAPWFSKEGKVVSKHRFTRGQPLGLGPSFFLFGYTHNVLLQGLCVKHSILEQPFVVLGDDVCISDQKLATLYRATLANLGCKISESKSIVSDKFAEFAGVVISPNRKIYQYKWRDLDDSNFIDFCRQLGPKSIELLSRRQRAVIEAIAEIPSEIGGLGWNPKGKSVSDRLSTPLAQMFLEQDNQSYLLFESVLSRDRKFWKSQKLRSITPYQEILDPGVNPNPRFHRDGQSLGWFEQIDNLFWRNVTEEAKVYSANQFHLPDYVLVNREHPPPKGYVSASPTLGDPRQIRNNCTVAILERKIKSVGLSRQVI